MNTSSPTGDHLFASDGLAALHDADVRIPQLHPERGYAGDPVELPVIVDPFAAQGLAAPSQRRTQTLSRPTWRVPFTGSAEVFRVNPQAIETEWPQGIVEGDEVVFTFAVAGDDPAEQRRYFDRQVALVERFLTHLRSQRPA